MPCLALVLLAGQCTALAPMPAVARPVASVQRAPALVMDAAQQKEIEKLKAELKAAEATIARLAPTPANVIKQQAAEEAEDFENSRFPLFRKLQHSVAKSFEGLSQEEPLEHAALKREDFVPPQWSVDELFSKYDADRSGQLDIDEFRTFLTEMNLPMLDLSATAKSAEAFASDLAKGTAKSAETLVSDTAKSADDFAKSVFGSVNDLAKGVNDLAASAGVPGATASLPVTLVGGLASGYKEVLAASNGRDVPVEPLIMAIERQATLTTQLGAFMQLIVKLDQGNMRTVRERCARASS